MSVLLETSLGNLVVDLDWKGCQKACLNFLALCTTKYYNNTLFYNVETDYICYAGDPTGTGRGGESIFGQLYGPQASVFPDEKTGEDFGGEARSGALGLVSMRAEATGGHASAFSITLRDEPTAYSKVETPFGRVVEGLDVLSKISKTFIDDKGRPLADLRILHTYVLVDPLGAKALVAPLRGGDWPSPQLAKPAAEVVPARLSLEEAEDASAGAGDAVAEAAAVEAIAAAEAHNRAVTLEILGDLPDADMAPPENVLFVCKLNPVTQSDDLEILFSRFGDIKSCHIIRDWKTGDSLCYGFVEFGDKDACEKAYFKMNGVLVDDRRIRVDFSQSVSRLWAQFKQHGARQRREDNVGASEGNLRANKEMPRLRPQRPGQADGQSHHQPHRNQATHQHGRHEERARDGRRSPEERTDRQYRHDAHRHRPSSRSISPPDRRERSSDRRPRHDYERRGEERRREERRGEERDGERNRRERDPRDDRDYRDARSIQTDSREVRGGDRREKEKEKERDYRHRDGDRDRHRHERHRHSSRSRSSSVDRHRITHGTHGRDRERERERGGEGRR